MDVSIVITTRDRLKDLLECLFSIKNSNFEVLNWEVIIVDDCSSDGTAHITPDALGIENSRVIHNTSQQMMVKSRNIGVEASVGKYVLLIDDDNAIDSEMIRILVDFMDLHEDCGIVGPSMYYFDSKEKYLDYQRINLYSGRTTGIVSKTEKQFYDSDGIPNVFMVRKDVYEKCRGFDALLIQTFTEPDFAMRARGEGFKCVTIPKAITYHRVRKEDDYKPRSLGGKFNQKAYCLMRNRAVYIARYGSIMNKIVYIALFSLFWPVTYSVFASINGRGDLLKLYWMGFIDGERFMLTKKLINSLKI
ncbi:MAG: glycosyltransferase family 2 protein [Candidatus Levybacteria bacterium]|nr:glycosyltransferase family 2 protein [Candidatus Levybacteria bacterium]